MSPCVMGFGFIGFDGIAGYWFKYVIFLCFWTKSLASDKIHMAYSHTRVWVKKNKNKSYENTNAKI